MISFRFECFQGHEFWYGLLPEKWQARIVARKLCRGPYKGVDPGLLLIQMPRCAYRIIDRAGHVQVASERAPVVE